jgi:hypothetical protein
MQSQTKPQEKQITAKALALKEIAITGLGINCVTGTEPIALFGAVATNMGFTRPDPVLEAPSLTGEGYEQVMTCAMVDFTEDDPSDRMLSCLYPALFDAISSAEFETNARNNVLFYLVVPSPETLRGDCLQLDSWSSAISNALAEIGDVEIRIKGCQASVTEHLMFVGQGLQEGHWDTVIFAAVDSLVDVLTCHHLGKQGRIQTLETPDGVIPGEAAAVLVLERNDDSPLAAYAHLSSLAVYDEPHQGDADRQRMTGISQAMIASLQQAQTDLTQVDNLVLALGTEQSGMLEWYQTETRLWPYQVNEQDRLAQQLGELDRIEPQAPAIPEKLNINVSLGDIGIASLPVAIALAIARFNFSFPQVSKTLVVETGDTPYRSVALVSAPQVDGVAQRLGHAA